MKKTIFILLGFISSLCLNAQINTERVIIIGRNALYYEDYILSIQYFNQAIQSKPYLSEPYFYRAIAKFCLDDTKGAEDDCTLALKRNPFMTKAYQLRGDARQALGNYEGAIEDYSKSLEVYPNDKFVLINLALVNSQKKDYETSQEVFERLLKLHPKYSQAYLAQGVMLTEKGDTIKAFESYDKAVELDKYSSSPYSLRGILYYQTKKFDKAIEDMDEAIKLAPRQTGNYINRGLVKYSQNDLRGAMADYDKVIKDEPNNTIARFNRGLLRSKVGDNNRAIEDFDLVLSNEPTNYIAYINRSYTKTNIGDYKGALQDINIVIKRYPDAHVGYMARASIKRKMNDLEGARKDNDKASQLQKILRQKVESDDYKESDGKTREKSDKDLNKFDLLVVADKNDEEKSKYDNQNRGRIQDKAVQIELQARYNLSYYEKDDNISTSVHFHKTVNQVNEQKILPKVLKLTNSTIALNELQISRHFKSIDNLSLQLMSDPENPLLYYARGIDYMLVQDFVAAIKDLETSTALDPGFVPGYFSLAVVYSKKVALEVNENKALSIEDQITSISKNPLDPKANSGDNRFGNKVQQPTAQHELIKIEKNYNKVIDLDPSFIYAYYNRAEIAYARADYRGAILNYNEVIRQKADFAEAYFNRALCRFQLREEEKALEDMRKAGELGIVEAYSIIKRMTD